MKRLLGLIAALTTFAGLPARAEPPVWVAHGKGATLVLFGSVHILPHDLDWEPQTLKDALTGADELWFEIPLDPAALLDASRMALAQGMLPEDQALSAQLSPVGQQRLAQEALALNLPLDALQHLRPWLADLTLSQAASARDGATADQGVERQLADAAPQASRHALETPVQQIAIFAGASPQAQKASLEDTLRELVEDPGEMRRLIDAWRAGDVAAIDREGVQDLARVSPELFKALITDRNAAWVRTLIQRLNAPPAHDGRPDAVVVVVGAGHLVGPGGVPALLRARGVKVDGP
jgi:uncharacterized protein YbaP (TraB family)